MAGLSYGFEKPWRGRSELTVRQPGAARAWRLIQGSPEYNPDFNLTLGTAPLGDDEKRYFLWHIDVLPRLATPGGFELGSGMSINPVLPEDAARVLRNLSRGGGTRGPGHPTA